MNIRSVLSACERGPREADKRHEQKNKNRKADEIDEDTDDDDALLMMMMMLMYTQCTVQQCLSPQSTSAKLMSTAMAHGMTDRCS